MKHNFLIITLLGLFIISGCTEINQQADPPDSQVINDSTIDGNTPTNNSSSSDNCGITNCHGLDISCGNNPPQVCDASYMLGDFCRQYASCEVVKGKCQLLEDENFSICKNCIDDCNAIDDPMASFQCEGKCRELFE